VSGKTYTGNESMQWIDDVICLHLHLLGTMYSNGGIPLKYAPDGSVAIVSEPKPTQIFDGKEYVMEYALRPEVSLVKAWKADTRGNLIFRGTSQNSNPDCAVAGKVVLVSVCFSRLSTII
jgi:acyl CoA:acetate/3-ketoacid CoA transferase alpha subunit